MMKENSNITSSMQQQNINNVKNNRNKIAINKKILVYLSNGTIYEIKLSPTNINKSKHNRQKKRMYKSL
jgi:hypothetical protein